MGLSSLYNDHNIKIVAVIQQAQAEQESTTIADMFPKLTVAQRKFGVNPAFKSYFDPSFKREEGIGESHG